MAHYAKIEDGIVTNVIVAEAEFFESFVDDSPGEWLQTSYNTYGGVHLKGGTPLRENYAGIGYTYDITNDAFIAPQPYPSWLLGVASYIWQPPVALPEDAVANGGDKMYQWDEDTTNWVEVIEE